MCHAEALKNHKTKNKTPETQDKGSHGFTEFLPSSAAASIHYRYTLCTMNAAVQIRTDILCIYVIRTDILCTNPPWPAPAGVGRDPPVGV